MKIDAVTFPTLYQVRNVFTKTLSENPTGKSGMVSLPTIGCVNRTKVRLILTGMPHKMHALIGVLKVLSETNLLFV